MPKGFLNINAHDVVLHTQRLEKMHRSALPLAVRDTLSGLAFYTKKETMPAEAQKAFVNRSKGFFRANSRVKPARGWNIDKMEAVFGFINGDSIQAIEDLEKQEHGGTINGRAFIPLKTARTSKSEVRLVARRNRLSGIGNVVSTNDVSGRNHKQRVVKAAINASTSGYVLSKKVLYRVKKLNRKGRNTQLKLIPLYSYKSGRSVKVTGRKFMSKSIKRTMLGLDKMFIKNAEKQFKRLG